MNYKKLLVSILVPLSFGIIIGLITMPFINYQELTLPAGSPPSFIFPIAWTILYILMGVSVYLVSLNDKVPSIYYTQLIINGLWPIVFFIFKWYFAAYIVILILLIAIIIMIARFYKINKTAAFLQLPYLLWVVFATYLNIGVYLLIK